MNGLSVVPPPAPQGDPPTAAAPIKRLFEIEEHLNALVDSAELVEPAMEAEFITELEQTMLSAKAKRDAVASFFAQAEGQAAIAAKEIERLQKRKQFFESAVARMESYVLGVVMRQSPDSKGRFPRIEGNRSSFAAQRNPPTVAIVDEAAVPASCKAITVTLPLALWGDLLDALDLERRAQVEDAVKRPDVAVLKPLVKRLITEAVPDWKAQLAEKPSVFADVAPGAAIAAGVFRLVRE